MIVVMKRLKIVAAVMFGNEEVGAEFGDPAIEGTSLPLFPSSGSVDLSATGIAAPEVFGQNFSGGDVSITNDGSAKAIVFLAHWCPHCQAEVPRVQEWLNAGGGVDGVAMYSVSTANNSGRGNFPPSAWLEGEEWASPVIVDDQENSVLHAFGSGGFPYWVFLNADGTVAVRTAGELTIAQLDEIMNGLDK